jgi:uncharacterized protein (TIGR00369 family)
MTAPDSSNSIEDTLARFGRRLPPFARWLGLEYESIDKDRLVARLIVREDTSNGGGTMHGGALMAFADTLGAVGTIINMPAGSRTTTLESKTNFIGAAPVGAVLRGEATPVHRGRTTQIWTTRITTEEGKLVAIITQTQIVLPAKG